MLQKYNSKKSVVALGLTLTLAFTFAIFAVPQFAGTSFALTNEEELQQKIDERNRNIAELNKEIQQYSELVDKTGKEAQTLQNRIKQLEANAKAINADIQKTQKKIDVANLTIQKLGMNIQASQSKIGALQNGLEKSVRDIYAADNTSIVEQILAGKSFGELLFAIDSQFSFNDSMQNTIMQVREEKKKIETSKTETESQKKDLVALQTELSSKKKAVDYTKNEENQTLKSTKNQEQNYQKILQDKQALKAAFEKEIFDYESRLKYTGNKGTLPAAGTSALSWPLDNVRITQFFGKSVAASRLYVSGSHNGVDFGVPIGTTVKAAGSGVVAGAGDTDITCKGASFGRWVLLKYDNGLATTYGHLSVISVTKGQQVKVGDVIGLSGNTGYSTGPHLHISAYAADSVQVLDRPSVSCGGKVYTMPISPVEAYLDPMLYFPPYNKK